MIYELIIIGCGPAGAAASVYAARKKLKTLFITSEWGGQSVVSEQIYNWIGTPSLSGTELAENFKKHVSANAGESLEIKEGEKVISLTKNAEGFLVKTDGNKEFGSKTILIASGSGRRKLVAKNADKLEHKGLTYCASCDGPLFEGMDVAVIGGGNAGFETAAQLLAYCNSVTLLNRSDAFRADEITGENKELKVSGIFVEIGQIPNTDFVKDILPLDKIGRIKIDPKTQKTEVPGIWAAGDCTDVLYHQNNIAAGDAVRALEDIYLAIHTK